MQHLEMLKRPIKPKRELLRYCLHRFTRERQPSPSFFGLTTPVGGPYDQPIPSLTLAHPEPELKPARQRGLLFFRGETPRAHPLSGHDEAIATR